MHKKVFRALISIMLVLAICSVTCTNAFAASIKKDKYVKEVFLSYGSTADEAKNYLTDNGYEVVDNNLNEGADDILSSKRAVYLGYKTTDKSDEAITDMKLMNMNGGYSVQDYQMLLDEQKANLKIFIDNFVVAVNEYRSNYNKKQQRAIAAHDLLNLLYDDDTEQYVGDLLLNKIKEEYTDEEWNALSAEEQKKAADMTTILMQGNTNSILIIEQVIALATDDNDSVWVTRYENAKTYDEMVEDLMNTKKITITEATKQLAAEYDEDAKVLASKFADYKTYLYENYVDTGISLDSSEADRTAYEKDKDDFDKMSWLVAGTHYELLATLMNDDISLLDLITSDDFDVDGEDRYLLYPLLSVLTKGQRACFDFLSMFQLVSCGINGDDTMQQTLKDIDISSLKENKNSVYDGIDRSIFTGDVAMTNEALRLQASSGKNPTTNWIDALSDTSLVLWYVLGATFIATATTWILGTGALNALGKHFLLKGTNLSQLARQTNNNFNFNWTVEELEQNQALVAKYEAQSASAYKTGNSLTQWGKVMNIAKYAMTAVFLILAGITLWYTISELMEYYDAKFTPIPMYIVDQTTNDDDESVYTYYKAVNCNRVASNLVTDSNKLLGEFGDLNGDVGKQWVALYTTTDKSAGDPITTDFVVQYNDTNIPKNKVALSMFGESVAQNLTNKKMGYTYADGKSGIYLFFGTDTSIFAGSIFSNGVYALGGAGVMVIFALAVSVIVKANRKKKANGEAAANA